MRGIIAVLLPTFACVPALDDVPWRVDAPRVLAARAVPAEAAPGEVVTLEFLVASPDRATPSVATWSLCSNPRSLAERNTVAAICVDDGSHLAATNGPTATLPADACARFGPIAPAPEPGQAPRRAVDPDRTGGFFQPARLHVELSSTPLIAFALVRLRCPLAGAPAEATVRFNERYRSNEHPTIDALVIPAFVSVGEQVQLDVQLSLASVEQFAYYDPSARDVVDQTEQIDVSWFATAGRLDAARTAATNSWVAPDEPGEVDLWVVARDSRGGLTWRSFTVTVQ